MSREHKILEHLKEAYKIADDGDNIFTNDALGGKFCFEIKQMIKPIIERVEKEIWIYNIPKEY